MIDADDPLRARLLQIEQLLKALQTRVEALERQLAPRTEHPSDEVAVRQKVSYDWQS